ncbi:MAG: outer membrane beta-barrel domain-containing protein [Gammaproteobacteria bacterium]|nr:outer membrane beta-barrel domain-containing protein [Gammaproteobacteria bacterium]
MESRLQHILLESNYLWKRIVCVLLLMLSASVASAAQPEELELEPLVVREPPTREVDIDQLDSEDFEIGVYGGIMQIEDFGSDTVTGIRVAYHVTEDFFVEASYAQTTLGQTSFELLSGGAPLLTEAERDMTYYNASIGWNIFPGEVFIGGRWAFKGSMYVIAGAGSTEFGGNNLFTINAGVGYRLIMTDWLALHIDVRDHYFESDLLGTKEGKHNIEFSGGLTVFF